MKLACLVGPMLVAIAPAAAMAEDVLQPKYPPGFDCSAVPAGSQRSACLDSQGKPAINIDPKDQTPAAGALQTPGTVSPPTVPDQPRGETGGGPGSGGAAGTSQ